MSREDRRLIDGSAGRIELVLDVPEKDRYVGLAVVGHPHPLYGGTLDNKVAATIARSLAGLGWLTARFNFRGVGATEGTHDEGNGETDDFLHVVATVPVLPEFSARLPTPVPLALAGFSFGSFVAARGAQLLGARNPRLILVGAAAGKWDMPKVAGGTLVIHGELDETIPLADVLEWARPQNLPVVVIPGADHFFHRRLSLLKALISAHFVGISSFDDAAQSL